VTRSQRVRRSQRAMSTVRVALIGSCLILFMAGLSQAQGTLKQIVDNGPRANRINLVIFGDGYTSSQEALFDSHALNNANGFMAEQPFAAYASYFNIFTIFVSSVESGSDHPNSGVFKNTYFNGSYDSYGITRLITIPPNSFDGNSANGSGKIYTLLGTHVPEYDIILLLVNDAEYGGSGGSIAISSIHPSAPEIVMHEIGHSFGKLADEYDSFTPGFSGHEAPNSTAQTIREFIKWNDWILPSTPIPTPETGTWTNVIGLFEGSTYEVTGWYRPKLDCKMNHLGPDFCAVCAQEFVLNQYKRVTPIDNVLPATPSVTLIGIIPVEFSVVPIDIISQTWETAWYLDDVLIPSETDLSIFMTAAGIGAGTHELRADIRDVSSFVLTDPGQLLTDSHLWSLNADACCAGSTGNVDCDGNDVVDISDLTVLIDHLFISFPPLCCPGEGNIDGDPDAIVDISDLTVLIDNLFINFTPTAPCQ